MNSGKSYRYLDLSHTVHDGLQTYPGLPAPVICDYLSREDSRQHYAGNTEFHIGHRLKRGFLLSDFNRKTFRQPIVEMGICYEQ